MKILRSWQLYFEGEEAGSGLINNRLFAYWNRYVRGFIPDYRLPQDGAGQEKIAYVMYTTVIIAASIIVLVFYRIHIDYIGIVISASLCYICYNDLVQHDIQTELG